MRVISLNSIYDMGVSTGNHMVYIIETISPHGTMFTVDC